MCAHFVNEPNSVFHFELKFIICDTVCICMCSPIYLEPLFFVHFQRQMKGKNLLFLFKNSLCLFNSLWTIYLCFLASQYEEMVNLIIWESLINFIYCQQIQNDLISRAIDHFQSISSPHSLLQIHLISSPFPHLACNSALIKNKIPPSSILYSRDIHIDTRYWYLLLLDYDSERCM